MLLQGEHLRWGCASLPFRGMQGEAGVREAESRDGREVRERERERVTVKSNSNYCKKQGREGSARGVCMGGRAGGRACARATVCRQKRASACVFARARSRATRVAQMSVCTYSRARFSVRVTRIGPHRRRGPRVSGPCGSCPGTACAKDIIYIIYNNIIIII